jgi:hypothetical protein
VSWLAAIIDPGSLVRRAQREERPPPEVGLALLLDGETQLYQMLAAKCGWPQVGEPVSARANSGKRLLAAVASHLWAVGEAEEMYFWLTKVRQSEVSTVASLLLAYLYSDTGRLPEAIKTLRRQAGRHHEPVEEALLRLQLAFRLSEAPDYAAALAEVDRVVRLSSRVKPRPWAMALRKLAEWNRFQYRWSGGLSPGNPLELPSRTEPPFLLRPAVTNADALSGFLNTTFERSLTDPYSRSVRFQPRDPVESGLTAGVIQSELLGDWYETRNARKLLGRYLVLTRLGTPQGVPPAAFELLRRAGDGDGVQQAARTVHRLGALGPLQLATQALIERRDLGAADPQASLRLLAVGADVLGEEEAGVALDQLLGASGFVPAHWADAPRALAGLVRVAPAVTQTEVALFVRTLATDQSNPALVQELTRVVDAVRWDAVDPVERSLWLDFVAQALDASAPAHFVAMRATLALASAEPEAIEKILTERLTTEPSLETLALVYDALHRLPLQSRKVAWELVGPALRQMRDQAHAGRYQFPSIDIASLATAVLGDSRNLEEWEELVAFLLDEAVAMAAKVGAFEGLAQPSTDIPTPVRQRLTVSLWEATGFEDPLFSRTEAFEAARLKLAARVGAASRDELLAALLGLAGGSSVASRLEAARVIPPLQRRVGTGVAATLALALSRDGNHDVRAAAGNAIAQLGESGDPLLQRSLEARLIDLLREPGAVVPLDTLRGIHQALTLGQELPTAVIREVRQLAKRHLSRAVRDGASEVSALATQSKRGQRVKRTG